MQEIARIAGVTSRTLRHYDDIGLVSPSRVGTNGYRYYDERALVRLQRVLLLRELGLSLPQIGDVLTKDVDEAAVLTTHLDVLRQEQDRLARQIAAVEHTIESLEGKETLMAEKALDGFDHTQYKDEVEERWGKDSFAKSDAWWSGKDPGEKADWKANLASLNNDWIEAATDPAVTADSEFAQAIAARHVDWLRGIPGTPANDSNGDLEGYVRGLAEMYVCDERFAANYGGAEGAKFVREALLNYMG